MTAFKLLLYYKAVTSLAAGKGGANFIHKHNCISPYNYTSLFVFIVVLLIQICKGAKVIK